MFRADTRRKRHGKILGNYNCGGVGKWGGDGRYIRNQYWRAERRYWHRYALAHLSYGVDSETEVRVPEGSVVMRRGMVGYRGW
jgi:hypothetical protein